MDEGRRIDRSRQEPRRRSRKKRKKRPSFSPFSSPLVYLLFIFGMSAILAAMSWSWANDVLALNKEDKSAVITIQEDDRFSSVVKQLKKNGMIEYKSVFRIFSFFMDAKDKITAGTYELNTDMDYRAIINNLSAKSDSRMTTTVIVPEGYTVAQIFKLLEQKGVSTVDKLNDMAANHDYKFSFLEGIPMGNANRLEGYLFPDTYEFYMGEDPLYVLNKMLLNFDFKVTEQLRKEIQDKGYSLQDLICIASMIEKETDGSDRTMISSVIHNRLKNKSGETAGFLNVDATIQYVLPEGQIVTPEDYKTVDSPYNTYKYKGLPPGPVGNPGMEAIYATLHPEKTNYYYYALGDDGTHHFFKNYNQMQAFLGS